MIGRVDRQGGTLFIVFTNCIRPFSNGPPQNRAGTISMHTARQEDLLVLFSLECMPGPSALRHRIRLDGFFRGNFRRQGFAFG